MRFVTGTISNIVIAHGKVLFTEKCVTCYSTYNRNAVLQENENNHFMIKLQYNPPLVIMWLGVIIFL
jgi:cytochrome c biogenesis factor